MSAAADPIDHLRAALPAGYSLDSQLGSGGQGSVYLGRVNGTPAAIKFYTPVAHPRRIERELTALRSIDCPHLVKVVATTEVDIAGSRVAVVAYEYLDGHDLTSLLLPGTLLDLPTLKGIGEHVAIAIEHLWAKKIVHRDIKPANIMKSSTRNVLVDVGIAKHLDRSLLTVAGNPGTMGYMSPEQAGGRRNLTNRSDAYSLGLTLYELAAGQHPFGRDQRRIGGACVPLRAHRPDLPPAFCALVEGMLNPVAHLRPDSLSHLFNQL